MEEEIWKDVKGYEGYYQVSNLGNVKGIKRKVKKGDVFITRHEKPIRSAINHKGYLRVEFSKDAKRKMGFVHRVVAMVFIPNPENKPQINHIDGDKKNNRVENLEWICQRENMSHRKMLSNKTFDSKTSGVFLDKRSLLWYARLKLDKVNFNLGHFKTEVEAANAVEMFMKERGIVNRYFIK